MRVIFPALTYGQNSMRWEVQMCCLAQSQPLSNNNNLSLSLCRHKHALVRATTSKLLTIIVTTSGADTVLSPTANKKFKERVLSAAAVFLEDPSIEARYCVCFNCSQVI
jgi:hypothetical protein